MSRLDNLKGKSHTFTPEEHAKGGKASGATRRRFKTFAEVLQAWAALETSEVNKAALTKLGLTEDQTNMVALVLPLLNNIKKGDTRSFELIMKYMGQDAKYQAEIRKLNEEIELLKRQYGATDSQPVQIVMDVSSNESE